MSKLFWALVSIGCINLISLSCVVLTSLVGFIVKRISKHTIADIVQYAISFAAGIFFGDVFVHLLPVAFKQFRIATPIAILVGIIIFYFIEDVIRIHRNIHKTHQKRHHYTQSTFATVAIVGEALHSFMDGAVIAGSYLVSGTLGFFTALAIALHEIPMTIADCSVLINLGFPPRKTFWIDFASILASFIGALFIFWVHASHPSIEQLLIPFTAGGFIYIAGSSLIPEMHKELIPKKSIIQLFLLILGMAIIVIPGLLS